MVLFSLCWLWLVYLAELLLSLECGRGWRSLNACIWPPAKGLASSGAGLHTGTACSGLSRPGDLRCTPRSRWDPISQGWTNTSSVVILSLGSLRSRHLIRHFARELRLSGRLNWPRLILANRPLCSAPWKGYLQWRNGYKDALTRFHLCFSLTFRPTWCTASRRGPTCPPTCPSTACWTSGSPGTRRRGSRACQTTGHPRNPPAQPRPRVIQALPQSWNEDKQLDR